jgi:gluconate kinase
LGAGNPVYPVSIDEVKMTTIQGLIKPNMAHQTSLWCLNIRGTNGCGKSSLARSFIESGSGVEEIIIPSWHKKKVAFTYCPDHNLLIIGGYANKCGGCDTMIKEQIVKLLQLGWLSQCNVLFEGVLVANSKLPYWHLMQQFDQEILPRDYGFIYLDIPVDECLKRIQIRNGGKAINEELVVAKHRDAIRYRDFHREQPNLITVTINANQPRHEVYLDTLSAIKRIQSGESVFSV